MNWECAIPGKKGVSTILLSFDISKDLGSEYTEPSRGSSIDIPLDTGTQVFQNIWVA